MTEPSKEKLKAQKINLSLHQHLFNQLVELSGMFALL